MLSITDLHPIAVHFPIVFFLTLAVFDAVMLFRGNTISGRACTANISTGLAVLAGLAAVATYVLGDLAYDAAVASGIPHGRLETHEGLGTTTAVVLAVWALLRGYLWWRNAPIEGVAKTAAVAIEAAGALLIIVTAYFGGQLVYELGVNVAHAAGG